MGIVVKPYRKYIDKSKAIEQMVGSVVKVGTV